MPHVSILSVESAVCTLSNSGYRKRVAVMLLEGKCNASNTNNNVCLHFWSLITGVLIRFYVCEFSFISGSRLIPRVKVYWKGNMWKIKLKYFIKKCILYNIPLYFHQYMSESWMWVHVLVGCTKFISLYFCFHYSNVNILALVYLGCIAWLLSETTYTNYQSQYKPVYLALNHKIHFGGEILTNHF